jgi:peptidoglycan hydrolase-like protein with peptidoglycan-binding domain
MTRAFGVALLGIALLRLGAAQTTQVKTAKSSSATSSKPSSSKSVAAKPAATRRKGRRAAPRPSYQLHPDPERYQQIQQALADRGYFKGQVNGQWGDDSVDALKRFQADQKLENDGKINAPTLIDLGLGPKHQAGSMAAPAATPANPTPPPSQTLPAAVATPPTGH